jgi:hypothetical protein
MEKAAMLVNKFDNDTARGVLCLMRCRGMTGKGVLLSTIMNNMPEIVLAMKRHQITGCDQLISSVDLRLNPNKRHPIVPTNVRDPRKSIRCSFSETVWFNMSCGSRIFTLMATRVKENTRIGA